VSELSPRGAIPSPPPAGSIDAQILATWRALLVNPDLDSFHALRAIDQLLDQRAGDAASQTTPAAPLTHPLVGTSAQHSVTAELLTILLCGLKTA
jgi:hypothetical protein